MTSEDNPNTLSHFLFKTLVLTGMRPLRDQAFNSTRNAKISKTENEALDAGSVGYEQEIIAGSPQWEKLLNMPTPALTREEEAFIDGPVETLCAMLDDWEIRTQTHDLPAEVWQFMKDAGFFALIIPKAYGGLAFSARAHSDIILKLASRSATACVTAMVPNSLGPAELLAVYGTPEQKSYYLPRLARGEEIPAFGLTETNAGSDASSMTSAGTVCKKDGVLGILLNWDKRYITLSPIATLIGIAFKLSDPDHLLGDEDDLGITLALIPASSPGVEIGRRHNPLGVPFQNGPTSGKDVWVPINAIIGGKEYAGQGWRMLMECLSVGRCISLPALSVGSAKLVTQMVTAYSRVRQQFKLAISQFEGIEEMIARIAGHTYLMEAARVATLQMLDRGEHPTILSAVMKYHTTEMARTILNDGMDVLGGKAICEGPDNLMAALYHAIPIGITVEGANILTRNLIIFGQGSVRSHPYLLKELRAAKLEDRKAAKAAFTKLMAFHVADSTRNGFNSVLFGLTDGHLSNTPACSATEYKYFRQINRLCAAYATMADITLMLLGDGVKRKERISALLGDTMSYLYLSSCALRHFRIEGSREEDKPLMQWSCEYLLFKAEDSLATLIHNFPLPSALQWANPFLYLLVFPKGRRFNQANHRLDKAVVNAVMKNPETRARLTSGVYQPQNTDEPLAVMEAAFSAVVHADTTLKTLRQQKKAGNLAGDSPEAWVNDALEKGLITEEQKQQLATAEQLRQRVIRVDDFNLNLDPVEKKTALANGKTLRNQYPLGTPWQINIPRQTLVDVLNKSVAHFGKLNAIDSMGKKYTYEELGDLVHKVAAGLQHLGVRKGDKVALFMPNTPYYTIFFFAIVKAGAVVVNVCPVLTTPEVKEQLEDSETKVLVTLNLKNTFEKADALGKAKVVEHVVVCPMSEVLPFLKAQAFRFLRKDSVVNLDKLSTDEAENKHLVTYKAVVNSRTPYCPQKISPDDLAALQYTGGTTGSPKGAMLTHYNLLANVYQIEHYFLESANKPKTDALLAQGNERVLGNIPFFHIFGLTVAMLCTVKMGNECIILPDPRNTKDTLKAIHEKKPTLFPAVPRLLQSLKENPKVHQYDLSSLTTVISGGAALPEQLKQAFEALAKTPGLIKEGYGLTEASPVIACNPAYGNNKVNSVGLPLPKTQIKIVDAENPNKTLQLGEVGEICIQGPQVMLGYYKQSAETAEVIIDGWLHTGDLGYMDDTYYIHITDRKKRLILVNGLNVYPTQVEAAIHRHPAVEECLVISVPDPRSGEAAKAFVRLKTGLGAYPSAEDMIRFLAKDLSRIEIPKHLVFVTEELPKTSVGKPDWKTLQDRERGLPLQVGEPDDADTVPLLEHPEEDTAYPKQEQA
ncbi:MAG: acyl-CoA dehydrogenase [Cyanobacteria bacterium P01_H01_bin.74]